jgi:hypothetical protein
MRIAEINNNRKVGTVARKYIQSGNNVASGFARPEPFPLGSPAMGGVAMSAGESVSGGKKFNLVGTLKKVGKKVASAAAPLVAIAEPIATKYAQQHLEKALTGMLQSSAESAAAGAGMTGGKRGAKMAAKEMMAHPDTKKMIAEALQSLTPVVQNMANSMVGGKRGIGNFFKKVGRTVGHTLASVAPQVLPVAFEALATATGNPELAIPAAAIGSQTGNLLKSKYGSGMRPRGRPRKMLALAAEEASASMPRAIGGKKRVSKSAGGVAMSAGVRSGGARGVIVSRIMKERGVSLPQASSIVKKEGLY